MEKLNDITLDFIIEYCKEHDEVAWLKEIANTPNLVDKNGKPRKIGFVELRNAFAKKFFPGLIQNKPRKKSMFDRIAEL